MPATGRCRECVVEVHDGAEHLSPPTPVEAFLRDAVPAGLPGGRGRPGRPRSTFAVLRRRLRIVAPEADADAAARSTPSSALVDGVVHYGETPIEPLRGGVYGVAVDLGTTTVVLELVDLLDGRTLEVVALENPQRFGGSDVINRISYDEADGGGELRQALRPARAQPRAAATSTSAAGIDRREVYEVVVVGNATMRDLFFGLDVAPIGQRPYKSITRARAARGAPRDHGADRTSPTSSACA